MKEHETTAAETESVRVWKVRDKFTKFLWAFSTDDCGLDFSKIFDIQDIFPILRNIAPSVSD